MYQSFKLMHASVHLISAGCRCWSALTWPHIFPAILEVPWEQSCKTFSLPGSFWKGWFSLIGQVTVGSSFRNNLKLWVVDNPTSLVTYWIYLLYLTLSAEKLEPEFMKRDLGSNGFFQVGTLLLVIKEHHHNSHDDHEYQKLQKTTAWVSKCLRVQKLSIPYGESSEWGKIDEHVHDHSYKNNQKAAILKELDILVVMICVPADYLLSGGKFCETLKHGENLFFSSSYPCVKNLL